MSAVTYLHRNVCRQVLRTIKIYSVHPKCGWDSEALYTEGGSSVTGSVCSSGRSNKSQHALHRLYPTVISGGTRVYYSQLWRSDAQTVKKIWLIPVSLWQFWTALIQRPTCWLCLHLILHLSMHHTLSFILPNFLKRIIVTVKFIVLVTQSVRWAFPESLLHAPRTTLHPHPHPPAPPPRIPGLPHPSHWIHPSSVF